MSHIHLTIPAILLPSGSPDDDERARNVLALLKADGVMYEYLGKIVVPNFETKTLEPVSRGRMAAEVSKLTRKHGPCKTTKVNAKGETVVSDAKVTPDAVSMICEYLGCLEVIKEERKAPGFWLSPSDDIIPLKQGLNTCGVWQWSDVAFRSMTLDQAKTKIRDLLKTVNFVAPSDRSRAISAMLTVGFKAFVNTVPEAYAPMTIITANGPGAGKDWLANLITIICCGSTSNVAGDGKGVGKTSFEEKFIEALNRGKQAITFSNIRNIGPTEFIESAVTENRIEGRASHERGKEYSILPVSVLMTTNGCELTKDMLTRSNIIELALTKESRKSIIKLNNIDRPEDALSAIMTIINYWMLAGRPGDRINNFEGGEFRFQDWARACDWIVRNVFSLVGISVDSAHKLETMSLSEQRKFLMRVAAEVLDGNEGPVNLRSADILDKIHSLDITIPKGIITSQTASAAAVQLNTWLSHVDLEEGHYFNDIGIWKTRCLSARGDKKVNAFCFSRKPSGVVAPAIVEVKKEEVVTEKVIAETPVPIKLEKSIFSRRSRTPEQIEAQKAAAKARKEQAEKPQGADIDNF